MDAVAWTPLLAGADADAARDAVHAIAAALREPDPSWRVGASLSNGAAGLAIFYGYLARSEPGQGHEDIGIRFLERAIEAVATDAMMSSLSHGFAGIAWATQHLTGTLVEPSEDDDDPNTAIDTALLDQLRAPSDGDYDLLTGIVGIGAYALERWPRPIARDMLVEVVARLGELAERDANGARWVSPPVTLDADSRARYPAGIYNAGLAHGVPCAIVMLAACIAADVSAAPARALLDDAVRWLLAQALPDAAPSRFPDIVSPGVAPEPSRLGWCYGDLSIATALLHAGRLADRADWAEQGALLARAAAARAEATSGVRDPCLCHGAAGLGLMFLRAARSTRSTRDPILEAAATRWYRIALAMRKPDSPVGGFEPMTEPGITLGQASVGVLTGSAGVALAFLAAIASDAPDWDRVLMLSVRELGRDPKLNSKA